MKKLKKSRAGFIYICQVENDWLKIGFTRSCPHRRLANLSSTSSRESFTMHAAKYMHDALDAEKKFHAALLTKKIKKQKEFFLVSVDVAKEILLDIFEEDKEIAKSKNFYMSSGADECEMTDSIKMLEKLSVQGNAYASFKVAQWLVQRSAWRQASFMFEASFDQGLPEGRLYQKHLETFLGECSVGDFFNLLIPHAQSLRAGYFVSDKTRDLLDIEQASWKTNPERAKEWGNTCSAHASESSGTASLQVGKSI